MTEKQKGTGWYSLPRSERKRKGIELTLSFSALVKLDRLARASGQKKSRVVERLILDAKV